MVCLAGISTTIFALLLATALVGGTANALAGGGTFLVFPALLLSGLDPIAANATSAATMFPGGIASAFVYRRGSTYDRGLLWALIAASVIGGAIGSTLVLLTPSERFARLVPYLMLSAAIVYSFSETLARIAAKKAARATSWWPLVVGQLLISIYGGYFGAGMGVLMIILYQLTANMDVQESAALRFYTSLAINAPAVTIFALRGLIVWKLSIPMALASISGGYGGAKLVRKLSPHAARYAVLAYAWVISLWLLFRDV